MLVLLSDLQSFTLPGVIMTAACRSVYEYWSFHKHNAHRPPTFTHYELGKRPILQHEPKCGMVNVLYDDKQKVGDSRLIVAEWSSTLQGWISKAAVKAFNKRDGCGVSVGDAIRKTAETGQPVHATFEGAAIRQSGYFEALFLPLYDKYPSSHPVIIVMDRITEE